MAPPAKKQKSAQPAKGQMSMKSFFKKGQDAGGPASQAAPPSTEDPVGKAKEGSSSSPSSSPAEKGSASAVPAVEQKSKAATSPDDGGRPKSDESQVETGDARGAASGGNAALEKEKVGGRQEPMGEDGDKVERQAKERRSKKAEDKDAVPSSSTVNGGRKRVRKSIVEDSSDEDGDDLHEGAPEKKSKKEGEASSNATDTKKLAKEEDDGEAMDVDPTAPVAASATDAACAKKTTANTESLKPSKGPSSTASAASVGVSGGSKAAASGVKEKKKKVSDSGAEEENDHDEGEDERRDDADDDDGGAEDEEGEDAEGGEDLLDGNEAPAPIKSVAEVLRYAGVASGGKGAKKPSGGKRKAYKQTTKDILTAIQAYELKPGKDGKRSMPYRFFCDVLSAIEAISARLEITAIVSELFIKTIQTCPSDLVLLMYLLCSEIAPAYEGSVLGLADKTLIGALAKSIGCSEKEITHKMKDETDLGVVAQKSKSSQRTLEFAQQPKPMTIQEVLEEFRKIAACQGQSSVNQKQDIVRKMLMRCAKDSAEVKFIIRGLQGKLRCRVQESTVLSALALALVQSPPEYPKPVEPPTDEQLQAMNPQCRSLVTSRGIDQKAEAAEAIIKQAFSECPNFDKLAEAVLTCPLWELPTRCRLTPGIPVKPMLAKASDSFEEVLKRMAGQHFTMEYKYDGERAQIHRDEHGNIEIFSRNLEKLTTKYPDVVESMTHAVKDGVTSFVLDSEAVAIDADGNFRPFQELMTRKKKDENIDDIKVKVRILAFDIIFLNGKPLLKHTLAERRKLLRESFVEADSFRFAVSMDHMETGDTSPIEVFLDEAVKNNCEGLMIKTLEDNATYEPTKRSLNWLKLKKDYLAGASGVADSLDLVVIGAYHGRGKRTGWYGAFLLACYDPDLEEYQSVCKLGTGFSEEFLAKAKEELEQHKLESKPRYYKTDETALNCDVWLDAKFLWEVKAADLTLSTVHKGGLSKVESGKGVALRFPRFIRVRPDKGVEDATTADQVVEMFRSQASIQGAQKDGGDDDDGYI